MNEGVSGLTEVFLDLDSNADRFWGLHALAKVHTNIVHVLLQDLVVFLCCIQFLLAQTILDCGSEREGEERKEGKEIGPGMKWQTRGEGRRETDESVKGKRKSDREM